MRFPLGNQFHQCLLFSLSVRRLRAAGEFWRDAACCLHGLEIRRNSFAGLVKLESLREGRKIRAGRPATIQPTMPGSVRQPTHLKAMQTAGLEAVRNVLLVEWGRCARDGKLDCLLKNSEIVGRSKMVRCKEAKKSRPRGVLGIHKRSGFFR